MSKWKFTNILGTFEIDSSMKLSKTENSDLPELQTEKALPLFKNPQFYSQFKKVNTELTKKQIRESVKLDNMIVQAVSSMEDIEKLVNTMCGRLREWHGLFMPEMAEMTEDNMQYIEKLKSGIESYDEMGANMSSDDRQAIKSFVERVDSLIELREEMRTYLDKLMNEVCPNVKEVAGSMIGGKLISYAGSLKKLSELPSSTVQLLGAERALFRHLKSGARPPKHGVIIQHSLVAGVNRDMKGKASRLLADKISIASKVDYFKGQFIGDKLRKELEAKLK